ncbi:site-2 protease family protein [Pelodictyon luteolum]|uniref:Putative membrane protein n=1 Tax=Chlorobium luteolum (strain DSM 273 / BCRC 81028 / 2530) TaxID=319225 RepID=Q3B5X1_CHLL3|nr:site-2 protease family protein [Pelodictyon luteolum]ABB23260.1 putative membrane protein [Pelodictyon luteolum DSM 273]
MSAATGQKPPLPPLREDLSLHPGPSARDGSPAWVLHDPGRNRFFQIDALGFEILSRWQMGDADAIAGSISDETTIAADASDVLEMARFLVVHELVRVMGEAGRERLKAATSKGRWPKLKWLLHNYLYFRFHLFNPERFLSKTYPYIRWIYTPIAAKVMLFIALVALYMAGRQWDAFTHSLSYFFSFQGVVLFGLAMFFAKVVHELGHGYTAYRYGCRVSSMGVVFIVLTPVFYTDASEAWLLTSRRKRIAIGAAGIVAELGLAVLATFLWSFLPEGAMRSAALLLATTSWVHTLLVNMMPYMRFDGYYLFSDLLGIPNLFERSFAMGRWWVRERLFGLGDPPPEEWDRRTEKLLVAFALGVWVYRFFLFIGIAFLVYHFTFKLLGIVLLTVELGWFVFLPIFGELKSWYAMRDRFIWNRNSRISAALAGLFLIGFVLPLSFSVDAPALLLPREHAVFYAPEDARVHTLRVREGE